MCIYIYIIFFLKDNFHLLWCCLFFFEGILFVYLTLQKDLNEFFSKFGQQVHEILVEIEYSTTATLTLALNYQSYPHDRFSLCQFTSKRRRLGSCKGMLKVQ